MSTKRYALLSDQGTACSETVLTEQEYNDPDVRESIEQHFCTGKADAPQRDTWTDVSDNEACQ